MFEDVIPVAAYRFTVNGVSLLNYLDSGSVPRMAEIRPYFRVVNDSRQSEWIAKGVYFVTPARPTPPPAS